MDVVFHKILFILTLFALSNLVMAQTNLPYPPHAPQVDAQTLTLYQRIIDQGLPNAVNTMVRAPEPENCISNEKADSSQAKPKAKSPKKRHYPLAGEVSEDYQERVHASEEVKEQIEAVMSSTPSFTSLDDLFASITNEPPPSCGYKLSKFSRSQVNAICAAMDAAANDRPVQCHVSNCTTASYIGIIKNLRKRDNWQSIKSRFTCSSPFPETYLNYGQRGPRWLASELDLGESRRISVSSNATTRNQNLLENFTAGFPRRGDPVLLQRNARNGNTGHSVIFSHFEASGGEIIESANGQTVAKVCYWSSNSSTNGSANRCEAIEKMSFLDTAHIN